MSIMKIPFTKEEELAYLNLDKIIIPKLRKILETKKPLLFEQWGGNCCRQSAYIAMKYLKKTLPHYKWSFWDGMFNDIYDGKPVRYNHAWVYGEGFSSGKKIFVDMGRIHTETIFSFVEKNEYPKNNPEYKDLEETSRHEVHGWGLDSDTEYFSGMIGIKLFELVMAECAQDIWE